MKKLAIGLIAVLPLALLCWAASLILFAPPEPPFDWSPSMTDARIVLLDHRYRVAAYVITWAIQLGYLAWLGLRWRTQSQAPRNRASR
jgi:hypothetical protein